MVLADQVTEELPFLSLSSSSLGLCTPLPFCCFILSFPPLFSWGPFLSHRPCVSSVFVLIFLCMILGTLSHADCLTTTKGDLIPVYRWRHLLESCTVWLLSQGRHLSIFCRWRTLVTLCPSDAADGRGFLVWWCCVVGDSVDPETAAFVFCVSVKTPLQGQPVVC